MFMNTPGPANITIFVSTFESVCHSIEKLDSKISAGKNTASNRCGSMRVNASRDDCNPSENPPFVFTTPMHMPMRSNATVYGTGLLITVNSDRFAVPSARAMKINHNIAVGSSCSVSSPPSEDAMMCRVPMPLQKSLLIILMMLRVVLPSSLMNPDVSLSPAGFGKDRRIRRRRRHRREEKIMPSRRETRRALKTAIILLLLFPEGRESAQSVLCCGEIEYFSNEGI